MDIFGILDPERDPDPHENLCGPETLTSTVYETITYFTVICAVYIYPNMSCRLAFGSTRAAFLEYNQSLWRIKTSYNFAVFMQVKEFSSLRGAKWKTYGLINFFLLSFLPNFVSIRKREAGPKDAKFGDG